MRQVLVGDAFQLWVQVYDGNPDLIVQAVLRDQAGAQIGVADLQHRGSGLYIGTWAPMPPHRVYVQYSFSKPEDYEIVAEQIEPLAKVEPPEKMLVGEVIAVEESSEIIGEVVNGEEAPADSE